MGEGKLIMVMAPKGHFFFNSNYYKIIILYDYYFYYNIKIDTFTQMLHPMQVSSEIIAVLAVFEAVTHSFPF